LVNWDLPELTELELRVDSQPVDTEELVFLTKFPKLEKIRLVYVDADEVVRLQTIIGYALRSGCFSDQLTELKLTVMVERNNSTQRGIELFDSLVAEMCLPHLKVKRFEICVRFDDYEVVRPFNLAISAEVTLHPPPPYCNAVNILQMQIGHTVNTNEAG
jgi:hypothetical protein